VVIGLEAVGQADQKADRVEVPLDLLELDAPLAERIAHGHVEHDHRDQ
jgi:hypothetical protein